ncbi:Histidinol-phosphate aminotransferase [Alkalibacterium sp. AK22]|uniref:pyridoxal phosphate-dependent aminotransferase n=1 Tax=Alkalibacterium sp. AK22 TaxID=1229520 RepID=UPI000452D1E4|nr:histidinol-phosphate transaminase [Alkalibacterium sp. AK22]EXJ22935.1 Histidinol-phosphate aminotransferase [Alkalibacterium sp. AK22]
MIRIDKNESPYRALTESEIAQIAIDTHFNEYAENEYEHLQQSYAAYNNLDPELLAFANGSDEWIQKAMIVLGEGPILILDPDFVMYEEYARQFDRKLVKVSCQKNWTFDYEEVYKHIKELRPSVFIFSQPNNPLGTLHPQAFIDKAAELMQEAGGYFIIDEAYGEFIEDQVSYPQGDHVIRFRTLSKVYGLAGLRVGVAISTALTMERLNSIAHPYPLNTFSLNMANYLLNQGNRLTRFIDMNRDLSKKLLRIFKEEVGDVIDILDSHTNFVFTYGDKAADLGKHVQANGFRPRMYPEAELTDLRKTVRYSIAKDEQLDELRQIIKDWRAMQ